jgi:hypothetical protein
MRVPSSYHEVASTPSLNSRTRRTSPTGVGGLQRVWPRSPATRAPRTNARCRARPCALITSGGRKNLPQRPRVQMKFAWGTPGKRF